MTDQPDPTQKLFNYIALLEQTNSQLVVTLKKRVELLRQFILDAPDPELWSEIIRDFESVIALGERVVEKKEIH